MLSSCAFSALGLAYSIYFHARWGQTVGKMVARVMVTRLDGGSITPRIARFHRWHRGHQDRVRP
jgi:uncharacterized RDD family membrane protein YckC